MLKMTKKRGLRLLSLVLASVFLISTLTGCKKEESTPSSDPLSQTQFLLNTVVTISLYDSKDEAILKEAFELCQKYENIFSRTSETSELYKLNHRQLPKEGDAYVVSDELASLLKDGYRYSELSKGNFDFAIEPISSLWDFTSDTPVLPSDESIQSNLQYINYEDVTIDGNLVTFANEHMGIDLGAIAKGYIADRIKEFLLSKGVTSAMINLGGNVLCVGKKPSGAPFNIGIQKPFADRNETVGIMQLEDVSVVSSGIYERFFTIDGVSYHHILNPHTGYSYKNNLISVTIISKLSVDGDGLSTSCFALGLEEGMKLINSLEDVEAVFITDDYEMHYSDQFQDKITIKE